METGRWKPLTGAIAEQKSLRLTPWVVARYCRERRGCLNRLAPNAQQELHEGQLTPEKDLDLPSGVGVDHGRCRLPGACVVGLRSLGRA